MNLSNEEIRKEKDRLKYTIDIIRDKISSLGQDLYDKQEKIQEFQKFVWDSRHDMDPAEMKSMMATSDLEVEMAMRKSKYFQKLFRIQNNPYFGSITFKTGTTNNNIYIGITHVEDEKNDVYLVHDWRSPICSLFYDYETGNAEYIAPEGIIKVKITNKRQFKIENGILIRLFDNNLNIDDELLQEVLSNSSTDKMKNIVNTIQQEQNLIIRNVEDKVLIVQGIAGSGKTSVALHRIAFLLYKIENLNSKNVLIFSPNNIFTEYISNVLPELGEDNTLQTTFSDFLSSYLKEFKDVETFTSFVERFYKYKEKNKELVKFKQSDIIVNCLDNYIDDLMNKIEFVDGIEVHDFSISKEELNYLLKDRYNNFNLYDRLNEISVKLCRDFYRGNKAKKSSIQSMLKRLLNIEFNYKKIYKDFYRSKFFINEYKSLLDNKEIDSFVRGKVIIYEDACLFLYIKSKLEGFAYNGLIKEVVIDEAQDYNFLQYKILKSIFKRSGFTILGDVNQTINPYYKYDSLKILENIFDDTNYLELSKTYRSSQEIIEYANKILGLDYVSAIRHSNNREVLYRKDNKNLKELLEKDINDLKNSNFTVAIITKTDEEANNIYELLKDKYKDISLLNSNSKEFNKKIVVVPAYVSKGLEFDSVIIYTDICNKYTNDEKYLYYVACTRAQHQLVIYNQLN